MDLMRNEWKPSDFAMLNNYLHDLSDTKYMQFSSKLIPNSTNLIGVRIPKLREIAKQIAKGNWREFVHGVSDKYFETTMMHGLVLGYAKAGTCEILECLDNFIPRINNWSICDSTCASLKFVKSNREETLHFINHHLKSDKELELRFAVVLLMDNYITDEYIDMVLDVLAKVKHDGYYVKMAVAWAISVCFVKYKDKTFELLKSGKLDDDTYKKTFRKIVESNRVDKDTKTQIYYLKNL